MIGVANLRIGPEAEEGAGGTRKRADVQVACLRMKHPSHEIRRAFTSLGGLSPIDGANLRDFAESCGNSVTNRPC